MTEYRRSPRAVWRASTAVLVAAVPPNSPTRVVGSAALVWSHLADPITLDELVERLARATGAAGATVRGDVAALLAQLEPLGLVEVVS